MGKRRSCYRIMAYSDSFCTVCPTGKTIDYGIPNHYEFKLPGNTSAKTLKEIKPSMFEVIGIPVFDSSGKVSMVMELVMDISEKGIEKIKSQEIMCHIEKMAAVGQLAAGVAHELNTPLATISIVSQELSGILDKCGEGKVHKDELKDYFSDMESEIKRCKTIVEDLLNFSKKHVYERIETDVNSLVPKAVNLIQRGSGYKDVTILIYLDSAMPIINTDPERFKQVIFNCLKNAVEAVIDKEDGKVIVTTSKEGNFIKVNICDNGSGISKDDLKKVFDPFFTTKSAGKGTGLGLSVSYGIMRDLMGDIKIESDAEEGTTVSLLLPAE
ncbi:MAG: hypothetical protein HZB79_11055 [Deltaproteobacteria bacterium]|nr:hypothetical protein [Deltaproteobacteria bacterium]